MHIRNTNYGNLPSSINSLYMDDSIRVCAEPHLLHMPVSFGSSFIFLSHSTHLFMPFLKPMQKVLPIQIITTSENRNFQRLVRKRILNYFKTSKRPRFQPSGDALIVIYGIVHEQNRQQSNRIERSKCQKKCSQDCSHIYSHPSFLIPFF